MNAKQKELRQAAGLEHLDQRSQPQRHRDRRLHPFSATMTPMPRWSRNLVIGPHIVISLPAASPAFHGKSLSDGRRVLFHMKHPTISPRAVFQRIEHGATAAIQARRHPTPDGASMREVPRGKVDDEAS